MKLKRIKVMPPELYALATGQSVGWRFVVQRRYDSGSWKRIFASVIQKRAAAPTESGAFSPMVAHIRTPALLPGGVGAEYRIRVRFYWYDAAGEPLTQARYRLPEYDVFRDGTYVWTDSHACHHAWIFE